MKNYYITEEQLNQMLGFLGEIPGKFSATPINMLIFIQQTQVNSVNTETVSSIKIDEKGTITCTGEINIKENAHSV